MQRAACKVRGLMKLYGGMNKMKKLIVFIFLFTAIFGLASFTNVSVEASTSVPYSVTGIFDDGTPEGWVNQSSNSARGNTLSVAIPSGQALAFGFVNGVLQPNFDLNAYTLTSRNKIELVFYPVDGSENPTKYAVAFVDSNGELIGVEYTNTGSVSDASLVMPSDRPGYVVSSGQKWVSVYGSELLSSITAHTVFALNYEVSGTPLGTVNITVIDGEGPESAVQFNELVTVAAPSTKESDVFIGWVEDGKTVSFDQEYTFTAIYDRTLTATYASSPVTLQALVTLSDPLEIRSGYVTFVGQFKLLPGQELIEYGFLFHPTAVKTLSVNSAGVVVAQSSNRQTDTNEYVTSFVEGTYSSFSAYLYYVQDSITYVIYSQKNLTNESLEDLATPTNLTINSSTELLTWDAVTNASIYRVYVGEETYTVTGTTELNLGSKTLDGNKNYEVAVVAVGDGDTFSDSVMSATSTYQRVRFSDLIISEYIEGSSSNKYLEIYNGTGSSVDLSNYNIQLFSNGASTASSTSALTGTLHHNQTIVYQNSAAALTLPVGVTANNLVAINYNGDDAIAIYKISTSSYVDIFGVIGQRPSPAWTSSSNSTLDKTLVRKSNVYVGVSVNPSFSSATGNNFDTLEAEWTQYAQNTVSNIGTHTVTFAITIQIPEE